MASVFDPYHRWLGIPPEEQPADHYRLLGIARFEADADVISNASDQRMSHLRTFASGKHSAQSQKLLNEVSLATRCLLDTARKTKYDEELRAKLAAQTAPAKRLPVAREESTLPRATMLPTSARPIPLQPVPAPVAYAAPPSPLPAPMPAEQSPIVSARRPLRRKSSNSLVVVVGFLLAALGGGAAIYAVYFNRTEPELVVEKPKPPEKKPIVVKPSEEPPPEKLPVKPPAVTPVDNKRLVWFYPSASAADPDVRGAFERLDGKRWKHSQAPGETRELVEVERTKQFIALRDPILRTTVRLHANHLDSSQDNKKWTTRQSGSWVPVEELAGLMDARTTPISSEPAKPAEVTTFLFAEGNTIRVAGSRSLLDVAEPFTIDFWFRRTGELDRSIGLLKLGQLSIILGVETKASQPPSYCELFAGKWSRMSRPERPDRLWHHIAVSGDAGKIFVHLDGKPYHSAPFEDFLVRELNPIEIGKADSQAGPLEFAGEIHSLQLSDKARYRIKDSFEPPTPHETELVAGASLELNGVQQRKPGAKPPDLADLTKPMPLPVPEPTGTEARLSVPAELALKQAQATITNVYGERVRLAMKPEEKQKLARELLEVAATDPSAAMAYALLQESRRLSMAAMDVALGIEIVSEISRRFEVERLAALSKLFGELSPRSLVQPQRDLLVIEAMTGAANALRDDNMIAADELSTHATSNAAKGKDAEQRKVARQLRDHVVAAKVLWDAKQLALKKLDEDSEDPAANLAVGRYYALAVEDFAKAAEYLAKGGESPLAEAGRKQLAATDDAGRFAAAEAWYRVLPSLKPVERIAIQRQVLVMSQESIGQLGGIAKGQAELFIKELQPIVAEADKANPVTAKAKLAPGLIARLFAGSGRSNPTPFLAVARDENDLNRLGNVAYEALEPYGSTVPRYALIGVVMIEKDCEVLIAIQDCTCNIGTATLQATNRIPVQRTVPMKKGIYPIAILATSSVFQFRVTSGGGSLLFHDEQMLNAELEKIVPLPGGNVSKGRRIDRLE